MTHDEIFLADILERPDDDLPRMIYADWLTDRDDPRGEFIHVQCLLARMSRDDPRHPRLEARQRELLDCHQDSWLGQLRPLLSGWTFKRGFLDAVTVPAATYMSLAAFPWPATVRRVEVDLDGFELPADVLGIVPESVAYECILLPLGLRGGMLVLAVQDPLDLDIVCKMQFILNRDIEVVAAPNRQVFDAIRRHYGDAGYAGGEPHLLAWLDWPPAFPADDVDLGSGDNGSPAARLLARIVAAAIGLNASEVHIEPGSDRIHVRYICDEGTAEGQITPVQLLWPVVARLRIMALIWIDDPRDVQSGTIRLTVRDRRIDVGVVIRRTNAGPAVELRFDRWILGSARGGA